jgi:hypothetical protein
MAPEFPGEIGRVGIRDGDANFLLGQVLKVFVALPFVLD